MGAVNRIARLETNHRLPAMLAEKGARLCGVTMIGGESNRVGPIDHMKLATKIDLSSTQNRCDTGMGCFGCPVHFLYLFFAVRGITLGKVENGKNQVTLVN